MSKEDGTTEAPSGVVEVLGAPNAPRLFDDMALTDISDFGSAMAAAEAAAGGALQSADDFGNGFAVVDDKDQLIGVPLVILEWRFNLGDFGDFVSATAVTEDGRKVVINDGSTGICQFLMDVTARRLAAGTDPKLAQMGLLCRKGLTVSRYKYTDPATGKQAPATTYYIG